MKSNLLDKKVLVGLISHNRFEFTKIALKTLQKTNLPFDLLVVDNGSQMNTKLAL